MTEKRLREREPDGLTSEGMDHFHSCGHSHGTTSERLEGIDMKLRGMRVV